MWNIAAIYNKCFIFVTFIFTKYVPNLNSLYFRWINMYLSPEELDCISSFSSLGNKQCGRPVNGSSEDESLTQ